MYPRFNKNLKKLGTLELSRKRTNIHSSTEAVAILTEKLTEPSNAQNV